MNDKTEIKTVEDLLSHIRKKIEKELTSKKKIPWNDKSFNLLTPEMKEKYKNIDMSSWSLGYDPQFSGKINVDIVLERKK
ncbi:hypothetical protein KAR91_26440 [Candidatus Pacearchaeota archaeon]|nr:hypothetical protein [Candidatus Pacearchaeota archaeon]